MTSIVMLFLQAAIIVILENQSITMKTESFPCLVEGRPDMYSIEMGSQGLSGVERGVYITCLLMDGLEMVQAV
jgi:hypothetical protein